MTSKTGKAPSFPVSTVVQARVQLYQPTQRPTKRLGEWIQTAWGRCRVTGRLGQRHADLIEAFLWCAEKRRETDDGAFELLVDPARVRQTLSEARHSLERIRSWIAELRAVCVEIETPNLSIVGGLIDHVELSSMTRNNPLTGRARNLWRVRVNKAFANLLANDLPVRYDPAPIARLSNGISQALARHVLTHKTQPPGGWILDSLIVTVGGAEANDNQAMRNRRREIRKDSHSLEELGIIVDHERVRKRQNG
ncbi:MAG: ABC transporter ATPase [Betaproteobacteria bacterium]|nr:ABC transporter ATPase [Betaproteobacteria bacterium]